MTATLPAGLERKLLGAVREWLPADYQTKSLGVDGPGVWGSEHPDTHGVRTQIVAVTGVRDEVGDIIVPGAFRDTLAVLEPKVVLGHDWNRPVGMPEAIEELLPGDPRLPRTDRFGKPWPAKAGALFARTRYLLDTKDGHDAYQHAVFFGSKLATSIGYVPDDEHTWHGVDPDTGKPTRFLGKVALYEYGQVLHGAHPLAGALADLKSAEIRSLQRKQRPSMEFKVRLVRDSGYWGLPIGTPIRPGMKPRGPKAQRIQSAGQAPREDIGAVEVDATALRIKPTARGKLKGDKAMDAAYDGLADLIAKEEADPFDSDSFVTVDSEGINKGAEFNPLDVLIRNAVVPADLEDWLRAGDFTSVRLGDRDDPDAQAAIEGRITDVMDAYREKYNAELVRQNDTGEDDVPNPDAPNDVEQAVESEPEGSTVSVRDLAAGDRVVDPDTGRAVTVAKVVDGGRESTRGKNRAVSGTYDDDGSQYYAVADIDNEYRVPAEGEMGEGSTYPSDAQMAESRTAVEAQGAATRRSESPGREVEPSDEDAPEAGPAESEVDSGGTGPLVVDGVEWSADASGERFTATMPEGHPNAGEPATVERRDNREWGWSIGDDPGGLSDYSGFDTYASAEDAMRAALAPDQADPDRGIRIGREPRTGLTTPAPEAPTEPAQTGGAAREPEEWDALAYRIQDALNPALANAEGELVDALTELGVDDPEGTAQRLEERYATDPDGANDEVLDLVDQIRLAGSAGQVDDAGPEADPEAARVEAEKEQTERLAAEELADLTEAADAGFGVVEAPDGELEADPDVADRQDRVGSLLSRAEAGSLDLSPDAISDDGLRETRTDLVSEIRLQEYVESRERGERARTRRQREQDAANGEPGETTDEPTDEPEEDAGPKPRPGVAGAAEDYADALEQGDPDRITATRVRLITSLNRSRSDSPLLADLRELVEAGVAPDPAQLRAAAEAIRAEQRERRNASARERRRVRRFERERLRSLLGQVEAEMRNRNLDYDPLPDSDADGTELIELPSAPGWAVQEEPGPFGMNPRQVHRLEGAGYTATVADTPGSDGGYEYTWAVHDDEGGTVASGRGSAGDVEAGRAAVELALEVQRNVGLLPPDSLPPTGSLPTASSATPLADVLTAAERMRERVAQGRVVNPITGVPDVFAEQGPTLIPPTTRVFDNIERVRVFLQSGTLNVRDPEARARALADIRWDTAKLTPGGAFFTAETSSDRGVKLFHAATGATFGAVGLGDLSAADKLRYGAILESLPDDTGRIVDWSIPEPKEVVEAMAQWRSGERTGRNAVSETAMEVLAQEKLRAGQWNHKLVARSDISFSAGSDAVTNQTRLDKARELHSSLVQLMNVQRGKPSADQRKALETSRAAMTLEKLGAPDAAAVVLRRQAAEFREKYGDDAHAYGAVLMDAMAEAILSAYSPVRSPGDRVASLRPGERVFTTDHDGNDRTFRVLAEPRKPTGYSRAVTYPVVDEGTGRTLYLTVDDLEIRVITDPHQNFGSEYRSYRTSPDFVVLDRDEEPPVDLDDLRARTQGESSAIPVEVLDSAAEALPESRQETAARRATANPTGTRAPRRNSAAAPRRVAPQPVALPPAEQENLATAQARALATFYGGVTVGRGEPAPGGFASLDEVAEHLRGVESDPDSAKFAGSASYMLTEIAAGRVALSPGGHLIVQKDGTIAHAGTGTKVWPNGDAATEVTAAGYNLTAGMGAAVAAAMESGTFDGQTLPWGKDPRAAVAGVRAVRERIGGADPLVLATRAGYLDGVMGSKTVKGKEALMLRGFASVVPADLSANPEALSAAEPYQVSAPYGTAAGVRTRGDEERFISTTKAGSTLARRVQLELNLANFVHHLAPLDVVRRLTALADELEGKKIETSDGRGKNKTLVPSDDLRRVTRAIAAANDETRLSTAARLRRSGYRGLVRAEGEVQVSSTGYGERATELVEETRTMIRSGDGIRFYTDDRGRRHATFLDFDLVHQGGAYRDPHYLTNAERDGTPAGAFIDVDDKGRLSLEFQRENRRILVVLAPGTWSFESSDDQSDSGGDLESTIRQAYADLSVKPQDWVRLAKLREKLGGASKDEVDEVLMAMVRTGTVHLAPDSNTKVLTDEDRAAAVRIAGEDNHLLAIEVE
ncbi:MAG: hypothetical protein HOY78_02490 [Saccharothrix sp.]|nr:hypothetical protein [Saccharothrix sp.]